MLIDATPCFYVYLLRCKDNSLYCGQTLHLDRRVAHHNVGNAGAKYTRSRRPVRLVYYECHPTRRSALQREYAIKQLTKPAKERLVVSFHKSDFCLGHGV